MSPLQCLFCDQSNPPAAKFCNECGTPLHFKPCPQCDGINGRFAGSCYRCGAAFSAVAGQEEMVLSPLQDVSGPAATLATVERLGAANEARAAEPSPNDDDVIAPTRARALGSWPIAAGVGLLAIALPIVAIVVLNVDRDGGAEADRTATLSAAPPAVEEPAGPPAPALLAAAPETRVEPVPAAASRSAPAKTAQKRGGTPARQAHARSGSASPTRVASAPKRDARATKSGTRNPAPAASASKPRPTRHAESVQIAVRAEEVPVVAQPEPVYRAFDRAAFDMAALGCSEGRMLADGCDVRLLAKGN